MLVLNETDKAGHLWMICVRAAQLHDCTFECQHCGVKWKENISLMKNCPSTIERKYERVY